jgi:endo-1,4-beta-xylanase
MRGLLAVLALAILVRLWGISDRRSWRSNQLPLLFDGQLKPKPAYQAILDTAAGKYPLTKP